MCISPKTASWNLLRSIFTVSNISADENSTYFLLYREIKYGYILLFYGCSCAVDEDNNALLVNQFKNAIKINENIQIVWSFSIAQLCSHSTLSLSSVDEKVRWLSVEPNIICQLKKSNNYPTYNTCGNCLNWRENRSLPSSVVFIYRTHSSKDSWANNCATKEPFENVDRRLSYEILSLKFILTSALHHMWRIVFACTCHQAWIYLLKIYKMNKNPIFI